jgi:hypothetical protein
VKNVASSVFTNQCLHFALFDQVTYFLTPPDQASNLTESSSIQSFWQSFMKIVWKNWPLECSQGNVDILHHLTWWPTFWSHLIQIRVREIINTIVLTMFHEDWIKMIINTIVLTMIHEDWMKNDVFKINHTIQSVR